MLIYLLFFTTLIILFFVIISNKFDYMSPSVLFIAPLTVSIMFAMIYADDWNVNICFETMALIVLGFLCFFCGEHVGRILSKQKRKLLINSENGHIPTVSALNIKKSKYVFMICYELLACYIYFRAITSIVIEKGYIYVLFDSTYAKTAASEVGFIVSNLYKVAIVFAYIALLHFLYNIIYKSGKRYAYISDGIIIVIYFVSVLITGSRGDVINFGVSAIFLFYILYCKKNGWRAKTIKKTFKRVLPATGIIIGMFYILKNVVNKSGQHESKLLATLSSYMGAQIDLLDRIIRGGISKPTYKLFGYESFYNLYQFFGKIGLIKEMEPVIFSFRAYNRIGCNVYTFFRRPYVDFGFVGCLLVTVACGIVFGYYYYKNIRNRSMNSESLLALLIYSYFINKVFMAFFDDYITFQLSINALIMVVLFHLLYKFAFGNIFKVKSRRRMSVKPPGREQYYV